MPCLMISFFPCWSLVVICIMLSKVYSSESLSFRQTLLQWWIFHLFWKWIPGFGISVSMNSLSNGRYFLAILWIHMPFFLLVFYCHSLPLCLVQWSFFASSGWIQSSFIRQVCPIYVINSFGWLSSLFTHVLFWLGFFPSVLVGGKSCGGVLFTARVVAFVVVWVCQGQVLMASRQGGVTCREVRQVLL